MDVYTCYKWFTSFFLLALVVVRANCYVVTEDIVDYLECYRCSAYENEEDFGDKLSQCQSGQVEDTVQCPYSIYRPMPDEKPEFFNLFPSCTVVKQKAAGVITSYTRGCKFYTNCTELDGCGDSMDETGVCTSCCDSDLCNAAPSTAINRLHGLWIVPAMLVAKLLVR